jgi:hypothetical protein
MSKILIPTTGPASWKELLRQPELQWKMGYSARTLALCWEASTAIPREVAAIMASALGTPELLFAVPEHKTPLPGGNTDSQCDILAMVRHPAGLAIYTIEGKVNEPFGETVGEWSGKATAGRVERLSYLCAMLGLSECPPTVRYQLLHRTVSALIEAERFNAVSAGMIVHSFSPERRWFEDFVAFVRLLGGGDIQPGEAKVVQTPSGRPLVLGWASGEAQFLSA